MKDSIYQSWLLLKRASVGNEIEALDALLADKIPKNLPKSKSKRKMNYPSGPARYDCTGPEWLELFRSRNEKKAGRKSTRKINNEIHMTNIGWLLCLLQYHYGDYLCHT